MQTTNTTMRITGRRNKKRLNNKIKNVTIRINIIKTAIQALIPVTMNILEVKS